MGRSNFAIYSHCLAHAQVRCRRSATSKQLQNSLFQYNAKRKQDKEPGVCYEMKGRDTEVNENTPIKEYDDYTDIISSYSGVPLCIYICIVHVYVHRPMYEGLVPCTHCGFLHDHVA